jgi:hypothetical protein
LAQELLEYKTNQIQELRSKKKDADEAAIIENYKPFSKNKITVKEPNSTKPCINVEYREYRCLFILLWLSWWRFSTLLAH